MTDSAGGPKTQAGKEVARWNATRHGIRSPAPVVPGLEKAEDWEAHRDGMLDSLSPEGHLEFVKFQSTYSRKPRQPRSYCPRSLRTGLPLTST